MNYSYIILLFILNIIIFFPNCYFFNKDSIVTYKSKKIYNKKWLIVLGTGRSGTTTILHMVNGISNTIHIQGETHNLPLFLLKLKNKIFNLPRKIRGAYYSMPLNKKKVLDSLQKIVVSQMGNLDNKKIIGFKEVTITDQKTLTFLQELFPNAKYIINWRFDTMKQLRSKTKNNMNRNNVPEARLIENMMSLRKWAKTLKPENVFYLPLENFSLEKFNKLITFVGFKECTFNFILHNNNGSYIQDKRKNLLSNKCKEL